MTTPASQTKGGRPKVELPPRLRNLIKSQLSKCQNISKTVSALAARGHIVSAGKVREVANDEGIKLARNVRLGQTPAIMKIATRMRRAGKTGQEIADAIQAELGVETTAEYINMMLRRRPAK